MATESIKVEIWGTIKIKVNLINIKQGLKSKNYIFIIDL